MRRLRRRHVILGLCYAVLLYPIADYTYWHRRDRRDHGGDYLTRRRR